LGEVKVLEDFTLIDGTGRPPAMHVSMIVENGRIGWIGPAAQIRMPAVAEKINLAGKFVMPGIINLHGHIGNTVDLTQDAKFFTRDRVLFSKADTAAWRASLRKSPVWRR
jgi:imidazolonepropionase-like amidohydrolase